MTYALRLPVAAFLICEDEWWVQRDFQMLGDG